MDLGQAKQPVQDHLLFIAARGAPSAPKARAAAAGTRPFIGRFWRVKDLTPMGFRTLSFVPKVASGSLESLGTGGALLRRIFLPLVAVIIPLSLI